MRVGEVVGERAAVFFLAASLFVCLSSGCGSGSSGRDAAPDAAPDAGASSDLSCTDESGSRLRLVYRDHDDGTRDVIGMRDTEVGVLCIVKATADAGMRCAPSFLDPLVVSGTVLYSDANCTNMIGTSLFAEDEVAAPRILSDSVLSGDGCDVVDLYYRVGASFPVVPGQTTVYRRSSPDDCVGQLAEDTPHYEITGELAPTDLVSMAAHWVGEGRVRMQAFEGEDGSRMCGVTAPMLDTALDDHPCDLRYAEDGAIRCLPHANHAFTYFRDAECTDAIQLAFGSGCGPIRPYISAEANEECPDRLRIHAVGEQVTGAVYSLDSGDSCEMWAVDGQNTYQQGPAIAATSFERFTRTYTDVGGRLERGDLVGGGIRLFRSLWRDSSLGVACSFRTASDGALRCLPADTADSPQARIGLLYTDPACTASVRVGRPSQFRCSAGAPTYAVGSGPEVAEVIGPASGPLYDNSSGACVAVPDPASFWELGPDLDPTLFVSGQVMMAAAPP